MILKLFRLRYLNRISSSNFHIIGELSSKGLPILKRTLDSNNDVLRVPSTPRSTGGIIIENLEIDGNCTLDSHMYGRNGIVLNYGTKNLIKNCYIHNVKERGIYLYDSPYSKVISCEIGYTYEASGIVATNQKLRSFYTISDCYIHDTEIDGIAIAADSVLVDHCYINNVGLQNLETTKPSCCVYVAENSENTVVRNCELSYSSFAGVELQSQHNHIDNNYIHECGWGVAIINSNNIVTNNYCYRCNQTGSNNNACGIGVYNTDSSRDFTQNLITGNSIDSNSECKFGVALINATNNLVGMNAIRNTTDVDVYQNITSSNTIVNNL